MDADKFRDELKTALDGDNITLKTVGEDGKHINITTAYLKGIDNADSTVQSKLMIGLKSVLPADITYNKFVAENVQSSTTVQPSISDDLKKGAIKATVFAMLIIFLYIMMRFRDWRYSAGTIR